MRVVTQLCVVAAVAVVALLPGQTLAQSEPVSQDRRPEAAAVDALVSAATESSEQPDEITVEGRRGNELGRYWLELERARDGIVEVFNRVNSNNDTDVTCRKEKPTGSRMNRNVCRSKAERASDAAAAKGFLNSLVLGTVGGSGGETATAASASASRSRAEGAGGDETARMQLEAEMKKLMAQNRELFNATVKYIEARDVYDEARGKNAATLEAADPGAR